MMKKMLFLMLFLLILGAANLSSQVRIGGDSEPQGAAILDLNADNSNTPTQKGGLALPRVELADRSAYLNGVKPVDGTIVFNTGGVLGAGVYCFRDSIWVMFKPWVSGAATTTAPISFSTSPPAVTWSKVYDGTLVGPFLPYSTIHVPITGYNTTTITRVFCRAPDSPSVSISYLTVVQGLVIRMDGATAFPSLRVRCYMASA